MKTFCKPLIVLGCVSLFLTGFFPSAFAGEANLKFDGENFSANLNGVPLRTVFEKISKEKGIRFKGDETLFDEKVSVRFTNLPLHEGMRRILSHTDYSLIFDKGMNLTGVFVTGKGKVSGIATKKSSSILTDEAFKIIKNCPPPGKPVTVSEREAEAFKVVRNAPPPGGPVEVRPEEAALFKVTKNSPPGK